MNPGHIVGLTVKQHNNDKSQTLYRQGTCVCECVCACIRGCVWFSVRMFTYCMCVYGETGPMMSMRWGPRGRLLVWMHGIYPLGVNFNLVPSIVTLPRCAPLGSAVNLCVDGPRGSPQRGHPAPWAPIWTSPHLSSLSLPSPPLFSRHPCNEPLMSLSLILARLGK